MKSILMCKYKRWSFVHFQVLLLFGHESRLHLQTHQDLASAVIGLLTRKETLLPRPLAHQ